MNVNDIANDVIPTDFSVMDMLDWIFHKQHLLAKKYVPIEIKNGLCVTEDMPVNLHTGKGQYRVKDFFGRMTEELIEARRAAKEHAHIPVHTIEELADALHFLVESYLLVGIKSTDFPSDSTQDKLSYLLDVSPVPPNLDKGIMETIDSVWAAANCLKQKPWKQTHQLTDVAKFYDEVKWALRYLLGTMRFCGLSPEEVFQVYFKKSAVNDFRIRSNY